jgi:hypothetical protein
MSLYGTISSISESPLVEGLIYAGTDDGLIQVTEDGGRTWRRAGRAPGVPERAFVNRIRTSRQDPDTVYAALDDHKSGDFKPYLIKSTDRGRTWTSIVRGLPEKTIVWSIIEDAVKKGLLFIGTEFGIYVSPDDGGRWIRLQGGLPTISFRDIAVQDREVDLVGASFGRGFYILDDYSPLRHIDAQALSSEGRLFPIKDARLYQPQRPLSLRGKAFLGDNYYLAPNPPFGAVLTYYLRDSLKTLREERLEKEKAAAAAGKDIPFPGWERLREEDREERPAVVLIVRDEEGRVVRRIEGPATSGIHRVSWDLRYPPVNPVELVEREMAPWSEPAVGPFVAPGKFTVSLAKRVNGEFIPLGDDQPLVVESLVLSPLQAEDRKALLAFQKEVGALQRVMMGATAAAQEVSRQIPFMKKALMDTPGAGRELFLRVAEFENRFREVTEALYGDRTVRRYSEPAKTPLVWMVDAQLRATAPITEQNRRNFEAAAAAFAGLQEDLRRLIDVEFKKLAADLEAAGAPWTPGRGVVKLSPGFREERPWRPFPSRRAEPRRPGPGRSGPMSRMDGNDLLRPQEFHGPERVIGAHREIVADGNDGQVETFVSDQFHVAEKARIAGKVHFRAVVRGQQKSRRISAVGSVRKRAAVNGVRQLEIAERVLEPASDVLGMCRRDALASEPVRYFEIADDPGSRSLGDGHGIADVVAVAVTDQNEIGFDIVRAGFSRRIAREKGIDQDFMAAGLQTECRVAVPGQFCHRCLLINIIKNMIID